MVVHRGVPDSATGIAMLKRGAGMKNTVVGIAGTSNEVFVKENGQIVVRKKGSMGAGLPSVKKCVKDTVKKGMDSIAIHKAVAACGNAGKGMKK